MEDSAEASRIETVTGRRPGPGIRAPRPGLALVGAMLVACACGPEEPPAGEEAEVPAGGEVLAEVAFDPRATFLRTSRDPALPAAPIRLRDLGVEPGDEIVLEAAGDWDAGRGDRYYGAAGLFSRSDSLLPGDSLNRVPGAVGVAVAPSARSWDTYSDGHPTDIPEDFRISEDGSPRREVTLTVPEGARYLFLTVLDHFFGDNAPGPEGWSVRISRAPSGGGR